jgi:hypothetical protein
VINEETPRTEPPEGYHHIWNDTADPLGWYAEPDPIATSPEALDYLLRHGLDAHRQWVARIKACARRQLHLF